MKEVFAGMLLLALLLAACAPQPAGPGPTASDQDQVQALQQAIADANHCQQDTDCALVGSYCPFGCHIYVNKNEADRIRALIEGYTSTCVYSCIASSGATCRDGRCAFIEGAPGTE